MMLRLAALPLALLLGSVFQDKPAPPAVKGQRVLSAGHSFHVFMPSILKELALGAEIKDHVQVDVQSIGGSRVIQHWDLADEKNKTDCVPVIQINNVEVDDRGYIYAVDRANSGLYILELTGEAREIANLPR